MYANLFSRGIRRICLALFTVAFTTAAQAQFVPDGTSKTFSGTTNLGVDLVVGSTVPNTTLTINGGGSVTGNNGYLGENSTASTNNLLTVSGAGSTVIIPGGGSVLRVGNDSAFNSMMISGGGSVSDGFGVIGFPSFATNNSVLITNSGSVWSNSSVIYVGEHGSSNSLTVAAGGLAVAFNGTIGVDSDASNNLVSVTGTGSTWNVPGQLNVGDAGVKNTLRVGSGGTVNTATLEIGNTAGSASNRLEVLGGSVTVTNGSSNAVLEARGGTMEFDGGVTTADEILATNTAAKLIFNDGTLITRSAIIKNSQDFVVGANPGSGASGAIFSNITQINIPGTGTSGPASPYPSIINVSSLAGAITKVTVTVSNLTHASDNDVGLVLVSPDGTAVTLIAGVSGGPSSIANVNLTFDDASSNFPISPLTTGTYSTSQFHANLLPPPGPAGSIPPGLTNLVGQNANGAWSLFAFDSAAGNTGHLSAWSLKIVTTTPAATWDVRSNAAVFTTVVGSLDIGTSGNNATLLVTNGAFVNINTNFNLGLNAGSSGNLAIIGPGHVVNDATAQVGAGGSFNTLLITNSNSLTNASSLTTLGDILIGAGDFLDSTQGDNNLAVVTGPNSKWLSTGNFFIGLDGSFNSFMISNGGVASSGGGVTIGEGVGNGTSGNNNQATVTGANSLWTSASITIGGNGINNTLSVSSSGAVQTGTVFLGQGSSSSGNQLSVGGGVLSVTNSTASAVLDLLHGSAIFNGGNITADKLLVNSGNSFFFENGTLVTRTAQIIGQDFLVGTSAGTGAAGAAFTNGAAIAIPNPAFGTVGPGAPYPSVINVFGLAGSVVSLTVTVSNLYHTFPNDVDLVLVSPDGVPVELMSGAGGNPDAVGVTLTFDDSSANLLPMGLAIPSGTYHPTGFRGETLPAPAPAGPYATNLATFAGLSPNGAWSLYVNDNASFDSGTLSNGWSLKIVTAPAATWDVRSNVTATTVVDALDIGAGGPNASLLVTNGATLSVGLGADGATSSSLGINAATLNNLAVIAGPSSLWTNTGSFNVGSNSPLNTLLITNGGRVTGTTAIIGNGSLANNNQAIVTGPNSLWTNSSFLEVGVSGSFNTLLIANGGQAVNPGGGLIGFHPGSQGNQVTVAGPNSAWINGGSLTVGVVSTFDFLLITNGGTVADTSGQIGFNSSTASNNQVIVTGANSLWTNSSLMQVGVNGASNALVIANGGSVVDSFGTIGLVAGADNNLVNVTGANSVWNNTSELDNGNFGAGSTLIITNGGTVQSPLVYMGLNSSSTGNLLTVGGGTLTCTNGANTGLVEVRRGQLIFNGGDITANNLMMTNVQGTFTFNAGDLDVMGATVSNNLPFIVGDGADGANYCMSSVGGSHTFANGIVITNNGSITGSGLVAGTLTVRPGGLLSPGETNIGIIDLSASPMLQGTAFMEISKNGSLKTSDTVQVFSHSLTYGGSLTVSNRGPSALALNDTFPLFIATSFAGVFAPVSLPALPSGLMWRNNLLNNGTIVVVAKTSPVISGLTQAGTNLSFNVTGGSPGAPWSLLTSTNAAAPVSTWTTNLTGVFDWMGNVSVTNGINVTEPGRFFLIYAP